MRPRLSLNEWYEMGIVNALEYLDACEYSEWNPNPSVVYVGRDEVSHNHMLACLSMGIC